MCRRTEDQRLPYKYLEQWHTYLEDPPVADAILDRLIHNSYLLALRGESMQKQKTTDQTDAEG